MGQMEHLLNVYATKAARGSIADFVGFVEVDDSEATTRLTPGLWLVRINFAQSWRLAACVRTVAHTCSQCNLVMRSSDCKLMVRISKSGLAHAVQIWQYDGAQTLGSYLRKRDCIHALAADLGVSEPAVVPTVMKQIFESLQVPCLIDTTSIWDAFSQLIAACQQMHAGNLLGRLK